MIIIIITAKRQILTCLNGARSIVRPAKRARYLAIFVACVRKILLCTRTFSETQQTQHEWAVPKNNYGIFAIDGTDLVAQFTSFTSVVFRTQINLFFI